MSAPNFVANGTIQPARFVVQDATVSDRVLQAVGSAAPIVGVSQHWSKLAPIPGATSQAADQNDQLKVFSVGDICFLNSTSAGWANGDRLTAAADGSGVTAVGTVYVGAIALGTVAGVGFGRVQVLSPGQKGV